MNKKQLLKQIRNLSATQCEQLGVEAPFKGQGNLKAVEAWLGDATLLDADGNALPLEAIFQDGDPAEVSLHMGMPLEDEVEEATEEAAEIMADEEAVQAMVSRSVRDELAKRKSLALPRTTGIKMETTGKKSKHFKSEQDQYIAGQWIGAKLLGLDSAKKWWNNNAPSGLKAQSEGVDTAGGYLVPSVLADAIIDVREEYGVCRRVARNFPMSSDVLNIPSQNAGATVYYPAENASITSADASWTNIQCTATRRACLMKWSNQLGADSLFGLSDVLADLIGRALGIREDTEFLQGDGTSSFGSVTGLSDATMTATETGTGTGWTGLVLADLTGVVGQLADKYHAGASWIMSRQFFAQVVTPIIAGAGGNTIDSLQIGASGTQLFGYPVNFSDQAPTASASSQRCCFFGNFQDGVVFADRQGIELATSEHVNFAEDQINIRGTSRYDIQCHDAGAYTAIVTG